MEAKEDRKEQNIFTKDSLRNSNPLFKQFEDDMDRVFGVTEGKQEARTFGIKPKKRDVI